MFVRERRGKLEVLKMTSLDTKEIDSYRAEWQQLYNASVVSDDVNGYTIRRVPSRFGTLYSVEGTGMAFHTFEEAIDYTELLAG